MSSFIAVPQRSTISDVVQHMIGVEAANRESKHLSLLHTQYSATTGSQHRSHDVPIAKIPSNRLFWKFLRRSIAENPRESQEPPLFILNDSITKDSLTINQQMLRSLIAAFEDHGDRNDADGAISQPDGTSLLTIVVSAATGQLRTFRCGHQFWDFVLLCYRDLLQKQGPEKQVGVESDSKAVSISGAHSKSDDILSLFKQQRSDENENTVLTVRVSSSVSAIEADTHGAAAQNAYRTTIQLLVKEWKDIVEKWNADTEPVVKTVPHSHSNLAIRKAESQHEEPEMKSVGMGRRRSNATWDPCSTDDVVNEAREKMMELEASSGSGQYWTHFMTHWRLLEAQYRNYL